MSEKKREPETLDKRSLNVSKLYTKRCKLTKERARELYRLLNDHLIELAQQVVGMSVEG